ncbi:two-component system regulatory protein YycI [Lihuaxuella thermophila]|uniref:Two-component signal transduction system YycFG, regulatory protein YycI n=1 Tax=Lihuaxuella thermophila TaxID=1173111 RepID=A0A1H8BHH3_9BACL|nr:two-component system regulatory protein YycI [Lihuaxuella thermophila]SEM82196.1 Two-component signal transduction system YycFG, regulatory protein YycI [Lihuaxuella thermophila]
MDWSRAKTILIIAFVILDLFLASQLNEMMQQKSQYVKANHITDQQINSLLKDAQVKLTASKPDNLSQINFYKATIHAMAGWQKDEQGGSVKNFPVPLSYQNDQDLERLLKEQIPFFHEYRRSAYDSVPNKKIVFLQTSRGHTIFDGRIEVNLAGSRKVESIRVVHYQLKNPSAVKLISFNTALFRLINSGETNKNTAITSAELGYRAKTYPTASDEFVLIPYWRFRVGNETLYVNAMNRGSNDDVEVVPSEKQIENKGKK